MSDLELEQAAIAPHRWLHLCGVFKQQQPGTGDPGAILYPRTTRIIKDVAMRSELYLVPGGRYLVVATHKRLSVWDLGYVSNAYCTLIASVGLEDADSQYRLFCMVQATPDEMGLIILVSLFKK